MFRKIFATLLMLATFFVAACGEQTETKVNKNLVVKVKNIPAKTKNALIKENLIKVKQKKNP